MSTNLTLAFPGTPIVSPFIAAGVSAGSSEGIGSVGGTVPWYCSLRTAVGKVGELETGGELGTDWFKMSMGCVSTLSGWTVVLMVVFSWFAPSGISWVIRWNFFWYIAQEAQKISSNIMITNIAFKEITFLNKYIEAINGNTRLELYFVTLPPAGNWEAVVLSCPLKCWICWLKWFFLARILGPENNNKYMDRGHVANKVRVCTVYSASWFLGNIYEEICINYRVYTYIFCRMNHLEKPSCEEKK